MCKARSLWAWSTSGCTTTPGHWLGDVSLEKSLIVLDQIAELPSIENIHFTVKKCRKIKILAYAKRVHAHISNNGLEAHKVIGNYMVPMFVECGSLADALGVFNRLIHRNEYSWTSLISGYLQCVEMQHALTMYKKMQEDTVPPSRYTLMPLLKACARLKDVDRGREMHAEIVQNGFETDIFIGSTLVDMYAKCGLLAEACEVLGKLPVRHVVSWTALIAGYVEHGPSEEALKCFEQMQREGIYPDTVTFGCALKACGSIGAIDEGQKIHVEITEKGFERDVLVGNTLIDMYAKCSSLLEAWEVFDKLPVRDVVSWTALIAGHAEHGDGREALKFLQQMKLEGISPNAVTFGCALKACASIRALAVGREIHTEIAQKGFERKLSVGNSLVDMYAKCGSSSEVMEVFEKLPVQDIVSWTALIAGYVDCGSSQEALKHFEQMQLEGVPADAVMLVCVLKAYGTTRGINKGREMHAEIIRKGVERELIVGSALVDMYAKCGLLPEAQEILDKLPARDVVSWSPLIAGYAKYGPPQEALECFERMQLEVVSPDAVIFVCGVKACGNIGAIGKGQEIHAEITQKGFERDVVVGSTLVDMYAKCGLLSEARDTFDRLPLQDDVAWASLIAGYAEHGPGQEALRCFEQMQLEGVFPTNITFLCVLKACGRMGAIGKGREIHTEIALRAFETEPFVGNALVDMYVKCGSLSEAHNAFDKVPVQDVVSWGALIAGFAEHGHAQKALKCFEEMQLGGVSSDDVTFVCSLKACGSIGAINKGRQIHADIAEKGIERDLFVGNTLVDMYAKCGSLSEAQEVFGKLPVRNVVSWSAMIKGYGINHEGNIAVQCFEDMLEDGVTPDAATFTCLLTACSHTNLLLKGQGYFKVIKEQYGISPTVDHYSCMTDLLARSGHLYEADKFLESMHCPPSEEAWAALLTACTTYGEAELGFKCFQQLVRMNPESAASYMLMANIYASAGRWHDANGIEQQRKHGSSKKKPGSALIEVNKQLHEFVVGDTQSEENSTMSKILSLRVKQEGYVPILDLVMS